MRARRNPISVRVIHATVVTFVAVGLLAGAGCKKQGFQLPPPEVAVTPSDPKRHAHLHIKFVGQAKGFEDIDIGPAWMGFLEKASILRRARRSNRAPSCTPSTPRELEGRVAEAKGQLTGPRPC